MPLHGHRRRARSPFRLVPLAPSILAACIAAIAAPGAHAAPVTGLDAFADLVQAAPEGSWIHANQNRFQDVWTPPELRPTITQNYPGSIIGAWSSFAWDTLRSSLIIYGGGHGNYTGNDVYRWNASTLEWQRAALPSLGRWVGVSYIPVDGALNAPQSAHTYDNTSYLQRADRYITFGGASMGGGGAYTAENPDGSVRRTGPYLFDPAKADPNKLGGSSGSGVNPATPGGNMWQNRDAYVNSKGDTLPPNFVWGTSDSTVENGKDVIYVTGPLGGITDQTLFRYTINDLADPTQDTVKIVGGAYYQRGEQGAGAFDPIHRIFVMTGDSQKDFLFWNLENEGPNNREIRVVLNDRPAGFHSGTMMGMDYDDERGRFVLWGGGGDVWELRPGSTRDPDGDNLVTDWSLSRLLLASDDTIPESDVGTGILGKWKYAQGLDLFVGLTNPVEGNVWFYKPVGWQNPFQTEQEPPPVEPPPPGGQVPEPGTLALLSAALLFGTLRARVQARR